MLEMALVDEGHEALLEGLLKSSPESHPYGEDLRGIGARYRDLLAVSQGLPGAYGIERPSEGLCHYDHIVGNLKNGILGTIMLLLEMPGSRNASTHLARARSGLDDLETYLLLMGEHSRYRDAEIRSGSGLYRTLAENQTPQGTTYPSFYIRESVKLLGEPARTAPTRASVPRELEHYLIAA